jgi:hypothetical protein
MRIVYVWSNGAFVSTLDPDFKVHFDELIQQYGSPCDILIKAEGEE